MPLSRGQHLHSSDGPNGPGNGHCDWDTTGCNPVDLVAIHIYRCPRPRKESITEQLGILLHEMCHAFLRLYRTREWFRGPSNKIGGDGHGPAFVDIALAVQDGVNDLGMDLLLFIPKRNHID